MLYTGSFDRSVDAKGRLALPTTFRSSLGEHVYVVPAIEVEALYVFSIDAYEAWIDSLFAGRPGKDGFDPRSEEDQKLRRLLNSRAKLVDVDSASRISIAKELRDALNIDREVTVVGNSDHIEIWSRETWEASQSDLQDMDLHALFFN